MTTQTTNDLKTAKKPKTIRLPPDADEKIKQLRARADEIEAALKERQRKADTRRKAQLGGWLLSLARRRPDVLTAALTSIHRASGIEPPEELRDFLLPPEASTGQKAENSMAKDRPLAANATKD